ncbi:MAG: CHAT domain-containing protein [Gomphosphaeria aponina SAG 52.96 = DSM 107014]|uniref:CHAT domain-containing protein n=1 Tax=Gomphosphaeria aponina SAG 52.96 = DSM 107014 TaxID=1521640 RepID=A0A941JUP9_9CHRO|nr:CHAT domain-containing protein [Gomphosphaeria aponina SAG 52.96 = DSM 107014]
MSALFGLSISVWSASQVAAQLPVVESQQLAQTQTALKLAKQGQQYYEKRQFDQAIALWDQAAVAYQQAGDEEGQLITLINKSQALKELGLYPTACSNLLAAFKVENPQCNNFYENNPIFQEQLASFILILQEKKEPLSLNQVIGLRSLGDVLNRLGVLEQSQAILTISLSAASGTPEEGAILLSLGNTQRAIANQTRDRWDYEQVNKIIDQQAPAMALQPYQQAFNYYQRAEKLNYGSITTQVQSQINYYTLLWDIQQWWNEQGNKRIASGKRTNEQIVVTRAEKFLAALNSELIKELEKQQKQLEGKINKLPQSRENIYARINLAQTLIQQGKIEQVQPLLTTALEAAHTLGDKQAESYALGYLGNIKDKQGQLPEATQLTQKALNLAQEQQLNGDAREVTYLWQSQLGRLLRKQGDTKGAIASYTAAFNTLESLRTDLNNNNKDVQFNFRDEVKPVYLELADLLLSAELTDAEIQSLGFFDLKTNVEKQENQGQKQQKTPTNQRLEMARTVVESLQIAELDNFFQDPCSEVLNQEIQIEEIDTQAVVIYPIIFPERLDLIVSFPGKPLNRFTINIPETQVNNTLETLYDYLDNPTVSDSARNLILYTLNPSPEELRANLQKLLPIFAQLYDWFVQPLATELTPEIETLVFVLNGPLQRVPMAALYHGKYLIEDYNIAIVPSLKLLDTRAIEKQQIRILAAGVSEAIKIEGRQTFPPLVNVPQELEGIMTTFPNSQQLLNETFTQKTLGSEIQTNNFPVIHLATHGLFSSQPENNFIITGDGKTISIEALSNLLSTVEGETPELLVLSACETATGDERAVLGLAGVAVRSGSRSTLASLWSVGDASTATLMGEFYGELRKPEVKKVQALRSAQLSLMESLKVGEKLPELQDLPPHPYYWAPYILVGNWQ